MAGAVPASAFVATAPITPTETPIAWEPAYTAADTEPISSV